MCHGPVAGPGHYPEAWAGGDLARPKPSPEHPQSICLDKGYDYESGSGTTIELVVRVASPRAGMCGYARKD